MKSDRLTDLLDRLERGAAQERRDAVSRLRALADPRAAPALVRLLDDAEVSWLAALALADMGEGAAPALAEAARRAKGYGRELVVRSLRSCPGEEAQDALMDALSDETSQVRWNAFLGLRGRAGAERIREPLAKLLEDPEPDIRRKAAILLAELADRRAVRALVEATESAGEIESYELATLLGDLGDELALPALLRLARTASSAREAVEALEKLLRNSADRIPSPELREIAGLLGLGYVVYEWVTVTGPDPVESGPVDTEAIRSLALAELDRRGRDRA